MTCKVRARVWKSGEWGEQVYTEIARSAKYIRPSPVHGSEVVDLAPERKIVTYTVVVAIEDGSGGVVVTAGVSVGVGNPTVAQ
jgi:hypothetical protein